MNNLEMTEALSNRILDLSQNNWEAMDICEKILKTYGPHTAENIFFEGMAKQNIRGDGIVMLYNSVAKQNLKVMGVLLNDKRAVDALGLAEGYLIELANELGKQIEAQAAAEAAEAPEYYVP